MVISHINSILIIMSSHELSLGSFIYSWNSKECLISREPYDDYCLFSGDLNRNILVLSEAMHFLIPKLSRLINRKYLLMLATQG